MMKTFCSLNMVMPNALKSHCQTSCHNVVRDVVKGLPSEGFTASGCCQRATVRVAAVRGAAVRELLSEGFSQSGHSEKAAVRGLQSEWLLIESVG